MATNKTDGIKNRDQTLVEYLTYEQGYSMVAIATHKADRHKMAAKYATQQTGEKQEAILCGALGVIVGVGGIMAGTIGLAVGGLALVPIAGLALVQRSAGESLAVKEQEFLRLNSDMIEHMASMEQQGLATTLKLADIYVSLFAEHAHKGNLLVSRDAFDRALAAHANTHINAGATVSQFARAMATGTEMQLPEPPAPPEPEYYEEEPEPPTATPYRFSPLAAGAIDVPVVSDRPALAPEVLTPGEVRMIDTLIDNPYQCRATIAGQRTGKTYGAAVATYVLKQDGTKVYYLNLMDHGQGNAAAFAHADKVAIGNLASLGNSRGAEDLVEKAIEIVEEFYGQDDAILVIDEWMSLGAETLQVGGLDTLWREIANKATALTSNGIGSGKAIWGLAPFFKATSLRKDARTLKLFAPMVLSIAPGQSVPWTNPKNGKTTQITMNAQVIGDVCTNWQNAIEPPTDEQCREWKRNGSDRIYWWNGEWNAVGDLPALPTATIKNTQPQNSVVKGDQAYFEQLVGHLKAANITIAAQSHILKEGKLIHENQGVGAAIAYLEKQLGV